MTMTAEQPRVAAAGVRRRFTVEEYYRMAEAGILAPDERVELIAGDILKMTPIGPPHSGIVDRLTRLLVRRLDDRAHVRVQGPTRLDPHTEPQPDLLVARRRESSYTDRHPQPGDILLAIEVADSSLRYDRVEKAPRYGRAGIPEMWIFDVAAREVIVFTAPSPDGYAEQAVLRGGDMLAAAAVRAAAGVDLRIPVDDVFP